MIKSAKNSYILLISISIIISCKTDKKSILTALTASECYWDVHDQYSTLNGRIGYCYKFENAGFCQYLYYNRRNEREKFDFDDVIIPKTWKVHGDTIIYLLGIERKIIYSSTDTILLENPVTKIVDTLIKNCR